MTQLPHTSSATKGLSAVPITEGLQKTDMVSTTQCLSLHFCAFLISMQLSAIHGFTAGLYWFCCWSKAIVVRLTHGCICLTESICLCLFAGGSGDVLYGTSLWSSGQQGGYDDGGCDEFAAGMLGLTASEEAEGEASRRAAVCDTQQTYARPQRQAQAVSQARDMLRHMSIHTSKSSQTPLPMHACMHTYVIVEGAHMKLQVNPLPLYMLTLISCQSPCQSDEHSSRRC